MSENVLVKQGLVKLRGSSLKLKTKKRKTNEHKKKIEDHIRAKALYLASNGKKSDRDIAIELGISRSSVERWRRDGDWSREIDQIQETVQQKVNEQLVQSKEIHGLLGEIDEKKLTKIVSSFVGKTVEEQVTNFLVHVHKEDLKDLSDLNIALRHHLTPAKLPFIDTRELNDLVAAKTAIIKAVRLIFGKATEITDEKEKTADKLQIVIQNNNKVHASLKEIGAIDEDTQIIDVAKQ